MEILSENQEYAISKFLQRYDYDAVLEILEEAGIIDGDLYFLIESCQYSVNFEFKRALESIEKMSSQMLTRREIKKLITNLNNLEQGEPEEILSELIENIKIQIINEEYIDFLGRLYRLKEALFNSETSKYGFIVYEYRIPRILISVMAGVALSIAGAIFQGVLRNPLASTDILGIGKGAGFFACIVLTIPIGKYISLPFAAILGGLLVGVILYLLTKRVAFKGTNIIIMGVAISALFDAGIQYLNINSKGNIQTVLLWLTGSVWGRGWDEVKILMPFIIIFIPLAIFMSDKIDILSLGDNVATNLGEKVNELKLFLLFIAIVLTASTVSVVGTIGFVGLISPHIAKNLVGYKHKLVIPLSGIIGGIILVTADLIGRTMFAPVEVPIGIVTSIVGAPYFLYLLIRRKAIK